MSDILGDLDPKQFIIVEVSCWVHFLFNWEKVVDVLCETCDCYPQILVVLNLGVLDL